MTEKMLVTATPPMQEEWKELEESELWELLTQLREVDPELYEDAVQRIPYLVKQNKLVFKSTQKTVKQLTKSAKQTKQTSSAKLCPCADTTSVSSTFSQTVHSVCFAPSFSQSSSTSVIHPPAT